MSDNTSNQYQIDLHWQNLLPVDDLAAAQTAPILKQIGVSDQTIMAQLGYDADDEMSQSQAEDAQKMINLSRGQAIPPIPPGQQQPGQQPPQSPFLARDGGQQQ